MLLLQMWLQPEVLTVSLHSLISMLLERIKTKQCTIKTNPLWQWNPRVHEAIPAWKHGQRLHPPHPLSPVCTCASWGDTQGQVPGFAGAQSGLCTLNISMTATHTTYCTGYTYSSTSLRIVWYSGVSAPWLAIPMKSDAKAPNSQPGWRYLVKELYFSAQLPCT